MIAGNVSSSGSPAEKLLAMYQESD
jgi:hypothetical protein